MTTTPFRSDFFATDRAFTPLSDAIRHRAISRRIEGAGLARLARMTMRMFAKDAVAAARKYRESRR